MKKKLITILLLLTTIFIPLTASAASMQYESYTKTLTEMKIMVGSRLGNEGQTEWVYYNSGIGSNPNHWYFHKMKRGNDSWNYGYCAGIGLEAPEYLVTATYEKRIDDSTNPLTNRSGQRLNSTQTALLKKLLSIGPQYKVNEIGNSATDANRYKIMAMNILIWEIVEGGRTTFELDTTQSGRNQYRPNVYHASDSSFYKIVNNQYDGDRSKYYNYKVFDAYKAIIDDINEVDSIPQTTNFGSKVLKWNGTSQKYESDEISVGIYNSCTSANSNVTVSTVSGNSKKIKISSSSKLTSQVKITCSYKAGNGAVNNDAFYYYVFPDGTCPSNNCQKVLYGQTGYQYDAYLYVTTETGKVVINKKDDKGSKLTGSKFQLQLLKPNGSYESAITLDSSTGSGTATIYKSGRYLVSETTTPYGYNTIAPFYLDIDLNTGCRANDNLVKGVVKLSCASNDKTKYELVIIDTPKSFKIVKKNQNNEQITGAKFKIKNSSNQYVKFTKNGNVYSYSTSGTVEEITGKTSNISLLPQGEYVIVETEAPAGYILPTKEADRSTKIKVDSKGDVTKYNNKTKKYENVQSSVGIEIYNYKSTLTINKTGKGKALTGVKFALYNNDKNSIYNLTYSNGVYTYEGQSSSEGTVLVTNSSGKIVINNLPEGTYQLKELETVDPFVVPEGDYAYTEIVIKVESDGVKIYQDGDLVTNNEIPIDNSPNTFTFYKKSENGEFLSGGLYKLQKLKSNGTVDHDIWLDKVENDGSYDSDADIFEVNMKSGKIMQFTLTNGSATFTNLEPSTKYRIVEIKQPDGYPDTNKGKYIEFSIDSHGRAMGANTLVNEKVVVEEGDSSAELIVSIQTGMDRVSYVLIIGGVVLLIGAAIIIVRKLDKNKK